MTRLAPAALIGAALLVAGAANAQPRDPDPTPPPATRFKCTDGGELRAQFASQNARLVAIVDSGDGQPHALPIIPWRDGPVMLTWTDGVRTLTWSPGVQIMWMEGAVHRMCGRGGHSH
jgi:hypothetical protein